MFAQEAESLTPERRNDDGRQKRKRNVCVFGAL